MPLYILNDNLDINGSIVKRGTLSGLHELSLKVRKKLEDSQSIRKLLTPPLDYFEPLGKYVILLNEQGVHTLGDFAGEHIANLPEQTKQYQPDVLELLTVGNSKKVCCGN